MKTLSALRACQVWIVVGKGGEEGSGDLQHLSVVFFKPASFSSLTFPSFPPPFGGCGWRDGYIHACTYVNTHACIFMMGAFQLIWVTHARQIGLQIHLKVIWWWQESYSAAVHAHTAVLRPRFALQNFPALSFFIVFLQTNRNLKIKN